MSHNQNINRLTVIANESYEDFAKALQQEIEDDCGVKFAGIRNTRDRTKIIHRKGFEVDPRFLEIWEKIKGKTTYKVFYETEKLIALASKEIKDLSEITAPAIRSRKTAVRMTKEGINGNYLGEKVENHDGNTWKIPDILGYIQEKTFESL